MKFRFFFSSRAACTILALCIWHECLQAQIIYITPSGAGNQSGSSWSNATPGSQMQSKIDNATSGSQLWVAAGTYKPTTGSDRNASYSLKGGIAIYGGFNGSENMLTQRNVTGNPTILSGDIGTAGSNTDNSYHVVVIAGLASTADSVIVDGFTITGGYANGNADINYGITPAYQGDGGGAYLINNVNGGKIALRNLNIRNNSANREGGGIEMNHSSSALSNCTFIQNTAGNGGGMLVDFSSSVTVANCVFSGNNCTESFGGGVVCQNRSTTTFHNSVFVGNSSAWNGGAVYAYYGGNVTLINCSITGNSAVFQGSGIYGGGAATLTVKNTIINNAIYNDLVAAQINISYSLTTAGGIGNINVAPLFVNESDPDGADNIFGTPDDGLKPQLTSQAINAGSNAAVPSGVFGDITGTPRILNGIVDMGAYESFVCPASGIIYVDNSIVTSGNGSSWTTAYKELREALNVARQCTNITTIYVAKGMYKPTVDANRDSAFTILRGGLKIYGGYPTGGGTRNITANPTILSGNIGTTNTSTDNSYHVLVIAGLGSSADSVIVDGFTVTGGNANGTTSMMYGTTSIYHGNAGGAYLINNANASKLVLRNLVVSNNYAVYAAGGMLINNSSPFVLACTFNGNSGGTLAGGLLVEVNASPKVASCLFVANSSPGGGALYHTANSSPGYYNCTFAGNSSTNGGFMFNNASSPAFYNSIIWNNTGTPSPFYATSGVVSLSFTNCITQATVAGAGNTTLNPSFVDASNLAGVDGIYGTADDGLQLSCSSPAINMGSNSAVAGIPTDMAGNSRVQRSTVDIGAYESPYDTPLRPSVTIAANPGSTVCAGTSVTFTAIPVNGGNSPVYQWKKNGTNVGSNSPIYTTADLVNNDKIVVQLTSNAACIYPATVSDTLAVTVNPLPAKPVVTTGGPTTFCAGGSVTLTTPVSASYLWSNGATTQSIMVNSSGTYNVVVTNSNGCSSSVSDATVVTVNDLPAKPTITASGSTTFCSGGSVTLTAPIAAFYLWSNGATTQSITVDQSGSYTVSAANSNGCTSPVSDAIMVTVNPLPAKPVITASGATTFCTGGSVTLTAPLSGSYLWSNGVTTQAITVTQSGSYSVSVANSSNCSSPASDVTVVTVNALPAKPTVTVVGPTTFCAGGSVSLMAPTGFTSYLWNTGATTQEITVNQSGSYSVTVTNSDGCTSPSSNITVVTVNALPAKPTVIAGGPTTFCAGGSVTLTAPIAASYLWSNDATTQAITVSQSSSYTASVTNAGGCYSLASDPAVVTVNPLPAKPVITASSPSTFNQGGSVTLTAPTAAAYLWSNGAVTQSVAVTISGSYTVKVTNSNGCTSPASDPVVVTVQAPQSNVSVSYLNGDYNQLTNNNIRPYLQLNNEGSTPVAYSSLTVRYWLTVENFAPMTNLVIDWAQLGSNKVIMKYVKLPQPRAGAFGYIEYSFAANAGNLAAMSNSGPIQSRAGKSDWTEFNEADDYSYAAYNNYTKNNRITLYQNGSLVWGTEPVAVIAVQSLKAYSQDRSSGTTTNTLSPWLKVNNEGNTPVSYKDITVRYWFTADGTQPLNYYLDYAQLGSNNVTSKFVKLATPLNGADTYLELGFSAADSLYPISTTGNVQQRIAKNDWSQFNQGNDHSYKAGSSAMSENLKVTVYVKGVLVYGTEPTATGAMAKSSPAASTQQAIAGVFTKEAAVQKLSVTVLNNPVMGNEVALLIRGAEGEHVQIMLTDGAGRVISAKEMKQAGAAENVRLGIIDVAAGPLFVRVSTAKESKTVQILRMR